jgi:DNA repair exonuclease SbcCD ATPase subunit
VKIERVRIKNFRGIDDLNLDFRDPAGKPLDLVVLAGPNGCGKTSVLEACLTACGHRHGRGGPKARDLTADVRAGREDFEVRVQLRSVSDQYPDIEVVRTRQTARQSSPNLPNGTRLEWSFDPIEYFSSWRWPSLVGAIPVTAGKRGKRPAPTEENRFWIVKSHLINLTALRGFEPDLGPVQEEPVFSKIRTLWQMFYPGTTTRFEARKATREEALDFELFLLDERAGDAIPVDRLSSGEIEVLTMIGWFAIKERMTNGILFIDEPELHLHQSWHRVVLRALRELLPTTQIICATHSADVLDSVEYFQRFTLLPSDDPRVRLERRAPDDEAGDGR